MSRDYIYHDLKCIIMGNEVDGWHFRLLVPIIKIAKVRDATRAMLSRRNSKAVLPGFTTDPKHLFAVVEGYKHTPMVGFNYDQYPCIRQLAFVEGQALRLATHLAHLWSGEPALPNRLFMAAVVGDSAKCLDIMADLRGWSDAEPIVLEARLLAYCAGTFDAFPAWPAQAAATATSVDATVDYFRRLICRAKVAKDPILLRTPRVTRLLHDLLYNVVALTHRYSPGRLQDPAPLNLTEVRMWVKRLMLHVHPDKGNKVAPTEFGYVADALALMTTA